MNYLVSGPEENDIIRHYICGLLGRRGDLQKRSGFGVSYVLYDHRACTKVTGSGKARPEAGAGLGCKTADRCGEQGELLHSEGGSSSLKFSSAFLIYESLRFEQKVSVLIQLLEYCPGCFISGNRIPLIIEVAYLRSDSFIRRFVDQSLIHEL